jgi:hypothetical protein
MKIILTILITALSLSAFTACSSALPMLPKVAATAAAIVGRLKAAPGTDAEREVLCKYCSAHRAEVETIREWAKANWSRVPEETKPALLAINDALNACDSETVTTAPEGRTTARKLLEALQRAVAFYRQLKAEGVI